LQAGCSSCVGSDTGVFDRYRCTRVDPQPRDDLKIDVGRRLPVGDFVAGDGHIEVAPEAEDLELDVQVHARAR